jgi:hypothetical protein
MMVINHLTDTGFHLNCGNKNTFIVMFFPNANVFDKGKKNFFKL